MIPSAPEPSLRTSFREVHLPEVFRAAVRGLNLEGLCRRGFSPQRITAIKQMHRLLYRQALTLDAARSAIAALPEQYPQAAADIAAMLDFLNASTRGIAR